MLKIRIHRGAKEIGGNCIELDADGVRLVLDVGRPLNAAMDAKIPLPSVSGLDNGDDPTLAGLVISHPHQDHYGLADQVSPKVPIYIGEAAHRILRESAFFTPSGLDCTPAGFLQNRKPFAVGPFRLTPFLNDHSAFDAYSLLIEAGGRRVFYTGDIRAHGRKAALFKKLLSSPPKNIHVLLMEGTHVRPDSDGSEKSPTEDEVEKACVETFKATRGAVLACYSAQNIDCLVTLYRAAIQSGRDFVMDLYTACIAKATGNKSIPQPGWDRVRVYLPNSQRSKVMKHGAFERTDAVKLYRIYPKELVQRRHELVVTFRQSLGSEFKSAGLLAEAQVVWSLWDGYLKQPKGKEFLEFLERNHVPLVHHHSSGHASIEDLKKLVTALNPGCVVPIHSFATDRFAKFFPRVTQHADGEWWEG